MTEKLFSFGAFLIGTGLIGVLVFGHILNLSNGFMIPGLVCLIGVIMMAVSVIRGL